jgi:hypothetical protein
MKFIPWFILTAILFFLLGLGIAIKTIPELVCEKDPLAEFKMCVELCKVDEQDWCYWQCSPHLNPPIRLI